MLNLPGPAVSPTQSTDLEGLDQIAPQSSSFEGEEVEESELVFVRGLGKACDHSCGLALKLLETEAVAIVAG